MAYIFSDLRRSSPISTLPFELLSYIFRLATHEANEDERYPVIDAETIKMPVILSRVSHFWRNVVQTTPSLWTSICVTGALVEDRIGRGSQLNDAHLLTSLRLSQHQSLDILIDARDEQWNFQEPEIEDMTEHEGPIYEPLFTPAHMRTAISLLLPHMFRWRSLTILTDSWVQMYAALRDIQPHIITKGAPCLEALTLMRCNDFISYSHTFAPSDMRLPAFLDMNNTTPSHHNLLPRLRHLTLSGVHVDWPSLSSILSKADHGLDTLDLSSHCLDVRPNLHEFRQLLSECPHLKSLVIKGSGPLIPDDNDGTSVASDDIQPVHLPHLRDMTLGYRSVFEGQTILKTIDAPHVESLTLEDGSHPGAVEDLNVSTLLAYIATRNTPEPMQDNYDSVFIYTTPDGEIAVDKDDFVILTPKSPIVNFSTNTPSRAIFPRLRNLTLQGVKAHESDVHHFLGALQHLRRLELKNMSMQSIQALHPQQALTDSFGAMSCPCPQLRYLCIRKVEHAQTEDLFFLIGAVARERFITGGSALQSIDIYIDHTQTHWPIENVIQLSNVGTMVKIIREEPLFYEDDYMDCDTESDLDSVF
ncbi:hypothetical protein C0993_009140 [Termitomyces sp. T159_Od127]|nr:hypothetical protein C0993_009140 [Termitomyces sp. T159_Od127]